MAHLQSSGNRIVILDAETTGLSPSNGDEMIELAIIDMSGQTLLNSLIKPIHLREWPEAERIHGITPDMVADATTLAELAPSIKRLLEGADVVIYNAPFDSAFLGDLLAGANQVHCCMLAYAKHVGEWSDYHQSFRWFKLTDAAKDVCFEWTGEAHRALADTLACRAVWHYLTDDSERERVDKLKEERRRVAKEQRRVAEALAQEKRERQREVDSASAHITGFLDHWYLGRYGIQKHWLNDVPPHDRDNQIALVFWGMPIRCLNLLDEHDTIYRKASDIPEHLVPALYFKQLKQRRWFMNELQPSAAYVGLKQGWPLYDKSEYDRIADAYPLRMNPYTLLANEQLVTKTTLLSMGYSAESIGNMRPVEERQNGYDSSWYCLYAIASRSEK